MKVNDVLRKGEVALRILVIKDDLCFCINCNAESMPAWMSANSLEDYTPDTAPMIDTNMTARQKQVAHERFTMIAPMLASRSFQGHEIHCSTVWRGLGAVHHRTFLNRFFPFVLSPFAEIESFSHSTESPSGKTYT